MPERPSFDELVERVRAFAEVRGWGPFHDAKNLAMAIASEAGELLAELRWLTPEESAPASLSPERLEAIAMEMADVAIFLIRMADVLHVDLLAAATEKLDRNEVRFPASPD